MDLRMVFLMVETLMLTWAQMSTDMYIERTDITPSRSFHSTNSSINSIVVLCAHHPPEIVPVSTRILMEIWTWAEHALTGHRMPISTLQPRDSFIHLQNLPNKDRYYIYLFALFLLARAHWAAFREQLAETTNWVLKTHSAFGLLISTFLQHWDLYLK